MKMKPLFKFLCKPDVFVFQPGKLTEAFKYFLQGMGYSEYIPPVCVCCSTPLAFPLQMECKCKCGGVFLCRERSCDNLALFLPCPNLSVAYVKDRRLSGGPGTLLPVHL